MLEILREWFDSVKQARTFPIVVVYILLITILANRIFTLQIINGEQIAQESQRKREKQRYTKSARGIIYDCNGVKLATNELVYSVTLENTGELKTNEEMNAMIYKLVKILERNQCSLNVEFQISMNKKGNLEFTDDESAINSFKRDVYCVQTVDDLSEEQVSATAQEVFDFLRDKGSGSNHFDISDEIYEYRDILTIMKVRYALFLNRYKQYIPITIASNIDDQTRIAVEENSCELPGVEVATDTYRRYTQAKYFSHILGYTGSLGETDLENLAKRQLGEKYTKKQLNQTIKKLEKKYTDQDQIGKSGIEKQYESVLHGAKGYENLIVNGTGRVLEVTKKKEATPGRDVYLTIDSEWQKACYDMLEKEMASILLSKIHRGKGNGTKGRAADGITISEYDVYYALVNNIIDISSLNDTTASEAEKNMYDKFVSRRDGVLSKLKTYLAVNSTTSTGELSEEYQAYQSCVYNFLKTEGILLSNQIDTSDETYKKFYKYESIGLSEFMQYAIANKWVDMTKLNVGKEYFSSTELYSKILDYTLKNIKDDEDFSKKIYYYMVFDGSLTGNQLCVILFEQGVLAYNEETVERLQVGAIDAYSFLRQQISNLTITPAMLALEPCSGSIVVTDPDDGSVKVCVSYPGYNSNKFANKVDASYFYKMSRDSSSPLFDRTIKMSIAPGSTYKPLVSIAGLTSGIISPGTRFNCSGTFTEVSNKPRCWNHSGHGSIPVSKGIEYSCNCFFYRVGYLMSDNYTNDSKGLATLRRYAEMFGFDGVSGISPEETEPHISDEYSVMSTIGQGNNSYTPAQLARYVTTLTNQKVCYDLNVVSKVKSANGKKARTHRANVHSTLENSGISSTTWNTVYTGMYGVINGSQSSVDQYFKSLKEDGVAVAGKTGTAQTNSYHPNDALFVSFAPYGNPEYCTTVVIQNGYTSANAAETASNVYKYIFAKSEKEKQNILKQAGSLVSTSGSSRVD